jgi:iron complex transport system ATP-binding protein
MVITSHESLRTLSSGVIGGGFGTHRAILTLHVDKNYRNPNPELDLIKAAEEAGFQDSFIGLMTAVFLDQVKITIQKTPDCSLAAVVTAGTGNISSPGFTTPVDPKPGTINIILIFDRILSPAAMVNAVITATEVKTDLIIKSGLTLPDGQPATGTSTDAVVVASIQNGKAVPYAGPATVPGWLIGKALRETLGSILDEKI